MTTVDSQANNSGWRRVLYLFLILAATGIATALQLEYRGFQGPLSDYLLIILLIIANFLLLAAVIFMMGRSLWKIWIEHKQGALGARFRTKLVVAFVSLSFIPPVLLFIIGSGMFTSSIERLFTLRIENALKDSVVVAQEYYNRLQQDALVFGKHIGGQMTEMRLIGRYENRVIKEYLTRKAAEYSLGSVELFTSPQSRIVSVVTEQYPEKTFTRTSADLVEETFTGQETVDLASSKKKGAIMRAVVPVYDAAGSPVPDDAEHPTPDADQPVPDKKVIAVLSVSYYIPQTLAAKAEEVKEGYTQYRSAFKHKEPIKLSWRLTFLAVTLALLLAAIWVALRVAAGITGPIKKLAEGTAAVAAGQLDYQIDEASGDEVGVLVASFNRMTQELKISRGQLEQESNYKKTILSNIDTGVVSIDRMRRITSINQSAANILGVREEELLGKRYDEAFSFLELGPIRNIFRKLEESESRVEEELSLNVRGRVLNVRIRVSTLRDGGGAIIGTLITVDDLTELLRAKKAETWQDVARSIAHEFKNPLTPIKLSAERLRKKHVEHAPDFDAVFDECSKTIVQEADGLRQLVDEFANFARMPNSNPSFQPLGPVLDGVIQLYAGAHKDITFIRDLSADLPDVYLDREQIKRVFINLFENAVEAMEGNGRITVSARMNGSNNVQIDVADEGPGISPEDMPRLFQPDFSRKKKKSGLGLAIVLRIIKDHGGSISVSPNDPRGARFVMELPMKR